MPNAVRAFRSINKNYFCKISYEKNIFHSNLNLETAKIALTRIRLLNKIGDLDEIVRVATVAMSILFDFTSLQSEEGTDSEEMEGLQNLHAAIISFKGAAQVRMSDYSEALPTLEQAFEMENCLTEKIVKPSF